MDEDKRILNFIEKKIIETAGDEQQQWVNKYDIFINENFFKKYNKIQNLKEVEKIRKEVLKYIQ